jgi:hypothetical protein
MRVLAILVIGCAVATAVGCSSNSGSDSSQEAQQAAAERGQERRAREARIEARARRQAARRREKREAARRLARREAARQRAQEAKSAVVREREALESADEEASECDPNYSGACLDPYASDYDCAGGSGDGPEYTGPVTVVGEDHYGLDSDGDGYACE